MDRQTEGNAYEPIVHEHRWVQKNNIFTHHQEKYHYTTPRPSRTLMLLVLNVRKNNLIIKQLFSIFLSWIKKSIWFFFLVTGVQVFIYFFFFYWFPRTQFHPLTWISQASCFKKNVIKLPLLFHQIFYCLDTRVSITKDMLELAKFSISFVCGVGLTKL